MVYWREQSRALRCRNGRRSIIVQIGKNKIRLPSSENSTRENDEGLLTPKESQFYSLQLKFQENSEATVLNFLLDCAGEDEGNNKKYTQACIKRKKKVKGL